MNDTREYACASCGATNRIPLARIAEGPVCGRCRKQLFPPAPIDVTDATWERQVAHAPIPVLVDFWAPWCGPCRMVAPVVDAIARERAGKLVVARLHTDENPRISARYDMRSIPTLLVLRDGLVVDRIVGAQPKAAIDARLRSWVG
jgi:thioredoxin 2